MFKEKQHKTIFIFFIFTSILLAITSIDCSHIYADSNESPTSVRGIAKNDPTNIRSKASTKSKVLARFSKGSVFEYKTYSDNPNWYEVSVDDKGKVRTGYVHKKHVEDSVKDQQIIKGITLESPTNIRTNPSTKAKKLTTLSQGTVVEYKTFSAYWYEITIDVNGESVTGYVHKKHVENSITNQYFIKGKTSKNPTKIRTNASTKSKVLTEIPKGDTVEYKDFSTYWYEITVEVNGNRKSGYVHKKHVEEKDTEKVNGVALKKKTNVRTEPSTKSDILTQFQVGQVLEYQTYPHNKDWNVITTWDNGRAKIGYIHKKHVEDINDYKPLLRGVALKNSTNIRVKPSTKSNVLTQFPMGQVLEYNSFPHNKNWNVITVWDNGKLKLGYVHKKHVEDINDNQHFLKGITLKKTTNIRINPSTNSEVLKKYPKGTVLDYKTFSKHWYEVTVNLNGKLKTGYIHKKHVEDVSKDKSTFKGLTTKNPTNIRTHASTKSNVLKRYPAKTIIDYKPFSSHWYEVVINSDRKFQVGYVHKKHVNENIFSETNYKSEFHKVVDEQMKHAPQIWSDGGFVDATREQVAYYINSSNFHKGDSEFFQFLDLSAQAGVNAEEVNSKILKGKGTLAGQAQAFIDGGEQHNINEIYLISHSILETGGGTSTLASGVPVDNKGNVVDKGKEKHIVYNMYGVNANDSNPLRDGAKYAFKEKWFTPEAAIKGGATFIGNNYINAGQNTLYKMRWNPDAPGSHQYATDVAWAVSQTNSIYNLYNLIEDYLLIFDIPKYKGQPDSSGSPSINSSYKKFPSPVDGQTTSNVNFRSGPNTNGTVYLTIPKGAKVQVLGSNGVWVKIKYKKKTGWIHGEYLKY